MNTSPKNHNSRKGQPKWHLLSLIVRTTSGIAQIANKKPPRYPINVFRIILPNLESTTIAEEYNKIFYSTN